jgi:hypothetical protein
MKLSKLFIMSSLISSIPKLLVSVPMVTIKTPQTPSKRACNPTKLSISSCGNVTHGEERELASSETAPSPEMKKSKHQLSLLILPSKMDQLMSATVSVTAILALVNIKVSDADGAWVELSATEELETPFTNAVGSRPDNHTTSPAQPISELLTVKVTPATGRTRHAQ